MKNYDRTSEYDRILFVKKLISIATEEHNNGNLLSVGTKAVIEAMDNYKIEIPVQVSGEYFDQFFEIVKKQKNEENAMYSTSLLLPVYLFGLLDEKRTIIFKEYLLSIISNHTASSVFTVLDYSKRYASKAEFPKKITLLEDEILDCLMERLMRDGPIDQRVIDYIVEYSPNKARKKLANWLFEFISHDIPNRIGHVLPSLQSHHNLFSEESRQIIFSGCRDLLKTVEASFEDDIKKTMNLFKMDDSN
jgi:hypothetical protein